MHLRKLTAEARYPAKLRAPLAALGAALLLVAGLASPVARAEDGAPADAEPAWLPSLSLGFETFEYSTTSSVTNLVNPPAQEGSVSHGSAQLVARIDAELMGPRLEALPGSPRLFARGGVGINTFSGSRIAEIGQLQGDPFGDISGFNRIRAGDLRAGCDNPPQCPATATPDEFQGQGSQVTGEPKTPEWNAALGVAFAFPLRRSLLLHLKPSVTYNYEHVELGGRIRTVVEADPVNEIFEIYEGTGSGSSDNHSLGLGLELDLALFRESRPVRVSLFLDTRFLWLLSDPTTAFTDSESTLTQWPAPFDLGPPPRFAETVTTPTSPVGAYRVTQDDFEIRGGAGVRLTWVGFGQR